MINGSKPLARSLRWGMVGGGGTSQIGYIHRSAALRDGAFTLLAGAFDIDAERGRDFGRSLGVVAERCYADYAEMFRAEAARADGIEAVSIATPNNTHYAICRAALEAGLHVVCEKPLCFSVDEAQALAALCERQRKVIGVTYGYAGHQMILQARQMIADGRLGEIRLVNMQFAHGFHAAPVEQDNPSTRWRVDPRFVGPSYVLGDLATHTLFLAETMAPQLKIRRLICSRQSFVPSRAPLEDNAYVLMEYHNGAVGSVWCSAVNCGSMHGQRCASSVKRLAWSGGMNNPISYASKCRASRCGSWSAACRISMRRRWRTIASAAVMRRGCLKPGRISTAASRWRWTPPIGATRPSWPTSGTRTCRLAHWA